MTDTAFDDYNDDLGITHLDVTLRFTTIHGRCQST